MDIIHNKDISTTGMTMSIVEKEEKNDDCEYIRHQFEMRSIT